MATNRERAFRVAQECGAGDDWAARYTNALAAAGLLAPDPEPRYYADGDGMYRIWFRLDSAPITGRCVLTFDSTAETRERESCLAALNALDEADRG